jgi:hypothetical protein
VLTAQVLHLETESSLLAARRQIIADRISLGRALGGRWMMRQRRQSGRFADDLPREDVSHEE